MRVGDLKKSNLDMTFRLDEISNIDWPLVVEIQQIIEKDKEK